MADTPPLWQILICTLPHRDEKLRRLLDVLAPQMTPEVRVLAYRDNRQVEHSGKMQALYSTATAKYVSMIDDDDLVPDDYVPTILTSLKLDPDYVGFRIRWTEDGAPQRPIVHSLECGNWFETGEGLFRDIGPVNPIRRELAVQAQWAGPCGADRRWADQLREKGQVRYELFIDREMYFYMHAAGDCFNQTSQARPMSELPPAPDYSFVDWL